ncbi:unnamed protein product [Didymodactylos carnosus]|uniref:Uncharacterized protein n=2 Tax=Didymodactylos carnosus TaxID=1234261 RepID=A0A8S2HEV0_9BILA|nr:unnamed protein product [Didymodactylos carnosus]CAF3613712.1 unnamed protein product [Didymodactylos carnosus]
MNTTPAERYQIILDQANKVIRTAQRKAADIRQPINLTVVDSSDTLTAFRRMDNVCTASIDISMTNATTVALFNDWTTAPLYNSSQPLGGSLYGLEETNGGLIVVEGKLPILVKEGIFIGALGVSGGSVQQDVEV